MPRMTIAAGVIIISIVFALSCERTTQVMETDMDVVTDLQNIPIEFGDLVAVTSLAEYPNWVQLWFQDADGVIRMVRIQIIANQMHKDVKVIARN